MITEKSKLRRKFGQHFTSISIFTEYILPKIKDSLFQFIWVDLYCGEGNLILPILNLIPESQRIEFFTQHIFLFDIQEEWVLKSREKAMSYGIPVKIVTKNIVQWDSLKAFPAFLLNKPFPIFHITNPPYLYLGYIVKTSETQKHLQYFQNENAGYQDLYQIAMMNDLRHGISNMIYIIPSNFLFGNSVSNKIRIDFFSEYTISHAVIFEKKVFEHTGTNVIICFFQKKSVPSPMDISFSALKIGIISQKKNYVLNSQYSYKAGNEFEEFITEYKTKIPIRFSFYLNHNEIKRNSGNVLIRLIDANKYENGAYAIFDAQVSSEFASKIQQNRLWIRTVDTGSMEGRVGLYFIQDIFHADGIVVTKATYRTHPIQIFFESPLSLVQLQIIHDYFNFVLEYLRESTDSEFMTTYKYSGAEYTRKYLGLSQVKKLIATCPLFSLNPNELIIFQNFISTKNISGLLNFMKDFLVH